MKNKRSLYIILVVIILIAVIISFENNSRTRISNDDSYIFSETLSVQIGDKYFISEDKPENEQEDLVYRDFLYTVNGEIYKKYDILADIEPLRISIENEAENTDPDIYTSFVLHSLTTILDKQSQNVEQIVKQYNLKEYEIINAVYTQKHSVKKLMLGPQWGESTMSRNFVVGKSAADETYKIYEFLMPIGLEEDTETNSAILSSNIKLYSYEDYELISEREIVDANAKINTLLTLNGEDFTGEVSASDIPKTSNYIKVEISSGKNVETYFVYGIHSKYYVEKPYEKINFITYDDYRDIHNLSYLGTIPDPIYAALIVSKLTDEEYESVGTHEIENPQKEDFRKVNFKLYIEYPNNANNRRVEFTEIYKLIDKNDENRYWSGSSFKQDNEKENFAIYENELIMYTRGLNEKDFKEIFNPLEVSVTWNDEINNQIAFGSYPGNQIIFEDDSVNISISLDIIGFFKNIISHDTFEIYASKDTEKLTEIFSKYMSAGGLKIFFESNLLKNNYSYIADKYIMSLEDMNVELIKESPSVSTIIQDYKVSYTYMDNKKKKHNLVDYYKLNIVNNKIDDIKLYDNKSSVVQ